MTSHRDDAVLRSIFTHYDVMSLKPPPLKNPAYATGRNGLSILSIILRFNGLYCSLGLYKSEVFKFYFIFS